MCRERQLKAGDRSLKTPLTRRELCRERQLQTVGRSLTTASTPSQTFERDEISRNQCELFGTCPMFQLAFSPDCRLRCLVAFRVHQGHRSTPGGVVACNSILVALESILEISCFTNVQTVIGTPQDIDPLHRDDDAIVEQGRQGDWLAMSDGAAAALRLALRMRLSGNPFRVGR